LGCQLSESWTKALMPYLKRWCWWMQGQWVDSIECQIKCHWIQNTFRHEACTSAKGYIKKPRNFMKGLIWYTCYSREPIYNRHRRPIEKRIKKSTELALWRHHCWGPATVRLRDFTHWAKNDKCTSTFDLWKFPRGNPVRYESMHGSG
jgi:hypothetical protein